MGCGLVEADVAHKIVIRCTPRDHVVGGEIIIGVAHGDANHYDLIVGDLCVLAHHSRLHDALAVDHCAEALRPGGQHQAVGDGAEIKMADIKILEKKLDYSK